MSAASSSKSWAERRVLVTGATGLVGAWLCRTLVDAGALVVALVRDQDPQSELFLSGTAQRLFVVNGALEDVHALRRAVEHHRVDTVFHLAAQTQVRTAHRNPLETFEANVRGTYLLLEACRLNRDLVRRIVVASSDKAYGDVEVLPYTEDMPLQAVYPYDVSKLCADAIARSYCKTYELPIAIARCGNIFGGGDLNWDRILPGTIRLLLENKAPVIRSNGLLVRDYIYVKDVVTSYLALADNAERHDVKGQAFNFSMEEPLNVLELVGRLQEIMGTSFAPIVHNAHVAEIDKQFLSSAKARGILGWRPQHTLRQGLDETVAWYRRYLARTA